MRQGTSFALGFVFFSTTWLTAQTPSDWPMLAHDAARSGATPVEIRPPFERKWYRLFADDGLQSGVQAVVADGLVFLGTLRGTVHAMDAETGVDRWKFQAGGPVLHACAAAGERVFFGAADARIYALRARDGSVEWTVTTGAAVWNAPAVAGGLVVAGSRDGSLYAIAAATGHVRWKSDLGAPILQSPAIDEPRGRVYAGAEDMRMRAVDLHDGRVLWTSEKLPGVSLRGYYPVVAPGGAVLVTSQPGIHVDAFQDLLLGMTREVFGDFASWRHKKHENEKLRRENFELLAKEGTLDLELDNLKRRLEAEPAYQTFFILDAASGKRRPLPPIVYSESMNGPGAPAIVTARDEVLVKFQALLRSRYEHYSPFLNVGRLDPETGRIEPALDESRTYGWHDSLLLVHDEQCQLSAAGRILLNAHQDNVNALDLDSRKGFAEPLANGVHEPAPGEALAIWAGVLRGEKLPQGKEWLARGTAVYGGGSVLDTAVSVAGDSFYYIPTHEISAGAALVAYRRKEGGTASKRSEMRPAKLTSDEWKRVQGLPWDWDTLESPRLRHVLDALPGGVPGTRRAPLVEEADAAVRKIPDADLDRLILEPAPWPAPGARPDAALRARLQVAVRELAGKSWRPLLFPAGKHPVEAYRLFADPSRTLLAVAMAFPFLDAETRDLARRRAPSGDAVRSLYDPPPEALVRVREDPPLSPLEALYPRWLWARASGDWSGLDAEWPRVRGLADEKPREPADDLGNARIAGLMAYTRLARRVQDEEAASRGLRAARTTLRERLRHELAHTRGGLIAQVPANRSVFARWRNLTPDVGRALAAYTRPIHAGLMALYIDHHRPAWWLAWNVETLFRNEAPLELPTASLEVFEARAWILGEPAPKLERFIDLPWCKGDELFIVKLALALGAPAS